MSIATNPFSKQFWGYHSLIILGTIVSKLPFCAQKAIGNSIGMIFYYFGKKRRGIAQINIKLAFNELNDIQKKQLLKKHFQSLGMSAIETMMSWMSSEKKLQTLGNITGLENLTSAQAKGNGVILISYHFTTIEIAGGILSSHTKFDALYRPHSNPVIEKIYADNRKKKYGGAIERNDIKSMIRSLKKGKIVWYAPDQNFGGKNSIFAPFFGIQAATNTATSRLAEMTGASVVPILFHRKSGYGKNDNKCYQIDILPEMDNFPSGNVENDTNKINQIFENFAKEHPEQYLWAHRRYKDRPEGEPPIY